MNPNDLSLGFVEALYADYIKDPASVSEDWRRYFSSLTGDAEFRARPQIGPSQGAPGLFRSLSTAPAPTTAASGAAPGVSSGDVAAFQAKVEQMIRAYRVRGHLFA